MHSRRVKKHPWFTLFLCLVLLVTLAITFLPAFLSSSLGVSLVEKQLSKRLQGTVTISSLHLRWFKSQTLEGFKYQSLDDNCLFVFDTLNIPDTLLSLLYHRQSAGLIELTSPTLQLRYLSSNIPSQESASTPPPSWPAALLKNIAIHQAHLLFSHDRHSVELNNVNARLNIQENTPSFIAATGAIASTKAPGSFDIQASFSNRSLYTAAINTSNFPLWICDDLFHLNGLLQETIGDVLNTKITHSLSEERWNTSVELSSANLKTSFHTQTLDRAVTLVKPASLALTVTQSSFQKIKSKWGINQDLSLSKEGTLQLAVDSLTIPYENHRLNFQHLAYQGRLISSPLAFTFLNKPEPISFNTFSITSSTKDISDSIEMGLQSSFHYYSKNPSHITTSFHFNPLSPSPLLSNLRVDIVKFPLALLEAFSMNTSSLIAALGESFSLKILPAYGNYSASFESSRLQIPELLFSMGDLISIKKAAAFTYVPSKALLSTDQVEITETAPFQGVLESFNFAFKNFQNSQENTLDFLVKLKNDSLSLRSPFIPYSLSFQNIVFSIVADSLTHVNLEFLGHLSFLDESKKSLFKEPLQCRLKTLIDMANRASIDLPLIETSLQNSQLKAFFSGALEDHFTKLAFSQPLELEWLPSKEAVSLAMRRINPLIHWNFTLPVKTIATIQPLYLNKPLFDQLVIEAQSSLEKFEIIDTTYFREFSCINTKAALQVNIPKKSFLCSMESYPVTKDVQGSVILCKMTSEDLLSFARFKEHLHLDISYKNIPSSLLDTIFGYKQALTTLLGQTFEGIVSLREQGIHSFISSKLLSPNANLSAAFSISNHILELTTPLDLSLTLTEESLSALEEMVGHNSNTDDFELISPALLHLNAKTLHWPLHHAFANNRSLKENIAHIIEHLDQSYFYLTTTVDHMLIQSNANGDLTALDHFALECSKVNPQSPLLFNLKTQVIDETKDSNKQKGFLTASVTLQSTKDKAQRPMLISKTEAKLDHFPSMLFDSFFQVMGFQQFPPSLFLGKQVNASLHMDLENLSGTIDFVVDSTDCKGNLNFYLVDGAVKLYKPVHATLRLSSRLADAFLKNMNFDLNIAKNPVELFISEKGFYFPLDPFDLKKLQIRKAQMNLGQMICTNYGNPYQLSTVFKLSLNHSTPIALWFAPMDFSIDHGTMSIDRTEVLFNNAYQIAFWGEIHLVQKVVDMILGLTEQSLRKGFGIRGLPKDFVLQVPMEGPIGNVKVNTELATTRVALLIAKSAGQGGLWGGIVGALSDFANDQENVPPAKPPFPWQDHLSQYEQEEKKESSVHIIR
jgi:hypothetical protein